jgi:transglycosylase-like protein with SLT domain
LIETKGRADGMAVLAAHATVLACGLLLAAPIVLAEQSRAATTATAWTASLDARTAAARNPMAFEQAAPAQAEEGPTGSVEWVPAPITPAAHTVVARPALALPAQGTGGVGVQAIYAAFGQSAGLTWALRVARCESHYNPLAINPQSGASGLFQFMPSTWNAHFAGWNIWDPYAQARAALIFYDQGATSAWTCK